MELLLEIKPDYILFNGSGTITLASPDLVRKYCIPGISKWSAMAAEAGVTTILHSCGKSRMLVDMLVENTSIDCINPLERSPMGDINLAELKQSRGRQIALMGNLHTTDVMLRGSAEEVFQASKEAILSAGEGGGFILSTGDQCGLDTPYENIFAMVEAAKEFGVYDDETGKLKSRSSNDERGKEKNGENSGE
jgi:uroporphyrinogen decarboxylase